MLRFILRHSVIITITAVLAIMMIVDLGEQRAAYVVDWYMVLVLVLIITVFYAIGYLVRKEIDE